LATRIGIWNLGFAILQNKAFKDVSRHSQRALLSDFVDIDFDTYGCGPVKRLVKRKGREFGQLLHAHQAHGQGRARAKVPTRAGATPSSTLVRP
jgi:hypothetical protein